MPGWWDNMGISFVKKLYERFGGTWDEINIMGIRNQYDDKSDLFNDQIIIATENEMHTYQSTTDPGLWWTLNPVMYDGITGAAHLCDGFHPHIWRVGTHASNTSFAHLALVQTGNSVKFWRDVDKNMEYDPQKDKIQSGYIGINLHRAGLDDPLNIGKYSAGCQVIRKHTEFSELLNIVLNSATYKKEKEFARFSYLLLNKKNMEEDLNGKD